MSLSTLSERKNFSREKYLEARKKTKLSYDAMEEKWQVRKEARFELEMERKRIKQLSEKYNRIWDDYHKKRDRLNAEIEALLPQADAEHKEAKRYLSLADNSSINGEIELFSLEAEIHRVRRDGINAKVQELIKQVKNARALAEKNAPRGSIDKTRFFELKEKAEKAKAEYEAALEEFQTNNTEKERLLAAYDAAYAEYLSLKRAQK